MNIKNDKNNINKLSNDEINRREKAVESILTNYSDNMTARIPERIEYLDSKINDKLEKNKKVEEEIEKDKLKFKTGYNKIIDLKNYKVHKNDHNTNYVKTTLDSSDNIKVELKNMYSSNDLKVNSNNTLN